MLSIGRVLLASTFLISGPIIAVAQTSEPERQSKYRAD